MQILLVFQKPMYSEEILTSYGTCSVSLYFLTKPLGIKCIPKFGLNTWAPLSSREPFLSDMISRNVEVKHGNVEVKLLRN